MTFLKNKNKRIWCFHLKTKQLHLNTQLIRLKNKKNSMFCLERN